MRLIDADALMQSEVKRCGCIPTIGSGYNNETSFKQILDNATTIEAEPVKHARWENVIESVSVMSCTGFPLTTTAETCTGCLFRSCFVGPKALLHDGICPNCGAKMDGGAENA